MRCTRDVPDARPRRAARNAGIVLRRDCRARLDGGGEAWRRRVTGKAWRRVTIDWPEKFPDAQLKPPLDAVNDLKISYLRLRVLLLFVCLLE